MSFLLLAQDVVSILQQDIYYNTVVNNGTTTKQLLQVNIIYYPAKHIGWVINPFPGRVLPIFRNFSLALFVVW
jgi:hypothetical protein